MIETSFLNPFSDEAKKIVSKYGSIESLDKENQELKTICSFAEDDLDSLSEESNIDKTNQEIENNKDSNKEDSEDKSNNQITKKPETIKELAQKRFEWFLFKNPKNLDDKRYDYLFNPEITPYDVAAFYFLCQTVATVFGSDSHEAKLLIDMQAELVSHRLNSYISSYGEGNTENFNDILSQYCDINNLYWTDIKEVLDIGEISLKELIISEGKIFLTFSDFTEFDGVIEGRDLEDMYMETCGNNIKIKLIKSFNMYLTKNYIKNVEEKAKYMIETDPIMNDLAEDIKDTERKLQEKRFSGVSSELAGNKPVSYDFESFPPCVRKCLRGIKSGGRNDAIVLFLTPFLSYARLFPGIFKLEGTPIKVSDVDPTLEITNNEVIPLIYEAANNCTPPLFKDQPQEKININSKLGFGMHETINSENEGQTDWYTPMSCEKIKLHMPQLCVPNAGCKKIGNPLTYYNRMKMLQSKESNQNSNPSVNSNRNNSDKEST